MRRLVLLPLLAAGIACHSAPDAGPEDTDPNPVHESPGISQGRAWGTSWLLVIDDTIEKQRTAETAVVKRIAQFTQIFSTYESESEIQRLNRLPVGGHASVSRPMQDALLLSRELCEKSHGAFWPFLGDLIIKEGFEPDALSPLQKQTLTHRMDKPGPTSSANMFRRDCTTIDIKGSTFRRRVTGRLNLNAVAEGLLLDAVYSDLRSAGISRFLFEFGGEMIAGAGPVSRGTVNHKWQAAIELVETRDSNPTGDSGEADRTDDIPDHGNTEALYVFYFEKAALSSSGTYRNRRNEKSHLIDRNDHGIQEIKAASVLCTGERSGALADGLATTASLLTLSEARQILAEYAQCALYYQAETQGGMITYRSPNWPDRH